MHQPRPITGAQGCGPLLHHILEAMDGGVKALELRWDELASSVVRKTV